MTFYIRLQGRRRRVEVYRGFGADMIARCDALDLFERFHAGDPIFDRPLSRDEMRKRATAALIGATACR